MWPKLSLVLPEPMSSFTSDNDVGIGLDVESLGAEPGRRTTADETRPVGGTLPPELPFWKDAECFYPHCGKSCFSSKIQNIGQAKSPLM